MATSVLTLYLRSVTLAFGEDVVANYALSALSSKEYGFVRVDWAKFLSLLTPREQAAVVSVRKKLSKMIRESGPKFKGAVETESQT